jgi:hypothetical protein
MRLLFGKENGGVRDYVGSAIGAKLFAEQPISTCCCQRTKRTMEGRLSVGTSPVSIFPYLW